MAPFTLRVLLSLVAGLAGGVSADPVTSPFAHVAFAGAAMVSVLAHANGWFLPRAVAPWIGVASAAWLLGLHAVDNALHSPLRTMLEQRLGGFALESAEDTRADEPILVEGRLRQDAALGATGVIVRFAVDRIWFGPYPERTHGGVSAVVGGEMAAEARTLWTEGRRIRAPILLR